MNKSFIEKYNDPKGHLEIFKVYPDGSSELHYSDDNVICSGMGATLATCFSTDFGTDVSSFMINYFQLGVSGGTALQVSSLGALSGSITQAEFGTNPNFDVHVHKIVSGTTVTSNQAFGTIPDGYIRKVDNSTVVWQIVVDQNTANDISRSGSTLSLNEIGLFSNNPLLKSPGSNYESYLCAYRYFTPIQKTSNFALVFRWKIRF